MSTRGPTCGHSACRQHWIDAGPGGCVILAREHRYLCHPAGEPCPDGCDATADPERLREYRGHEDRVARAYERLAQRLADRLRRWPRPSFPVPDDLPSKWVERVGRPAACDAARILREHGGPWSAALLQAVMESYPPQEWP